MKRYLAWWFLLVVAVLVFYPWFGPGILAYGDWVHNLPARVKEYYDHWLIWDGSVQLGTALGASAPNNIVLYLFAWVMAVMQQLLHISSSISTRLFWYFPYIVFALTGGWYLGWVVAKRRLVAMITSFVYTFSTFGLLTVQGGQMTIANAYALAPLVLALAITVRSEKNYRSVWWLSAAIWLQAIYDVRITYITFMAVALYLIVASMWRVDRAAAGALKRYAVALVTAGLLSAYWVIPMFLTNSIGASGMPTAANSVHWLPVLSYAEVANTLTANHVWWPWSVGELHSIQPLFVVLVLLGAAGLLNSRKRKRVLGLAVIWLVGIFLAKGVNDPLGGAYKWLFEHWPGFSFFRDPAKFFTLVMLGLAPLVGLGVMNGWQLARRPVRPVVLAAILILLVWPLYDLVGRPRHGTFVTHRVPAWSAELETWYTKNGGGRAAWLPRPQRYIVPTQATPVVDVSKLIEGSWAPLAAIADPARDPYGNFLTHPYTNWLLDQAGVTYVGVPLDTENEIFPHYQPRDSYVTQLNQLPWLQPVVDEPAELDLYRNEGGRPAVYAVGGVVTADPAALAARAGLPSVGIDDALFISDNAAGVPDVALQRTRVISLTKSIEEWQADYRAWSFTVDQPFNGRLVFDNSLASYPLTLDGEPLLTRATGEEVIAETVTLNPGEHTLRLDQSGAEKVLPESWAQLDWQPCPGNQAVTDLVVGDTNQLTLRSPLGHVAACVEVPTGSLAPGVYLLQSTFLNQPFTQAKVSLTYEIANGTEIIGQSKTTIQSGATLFISRFASAGLMRIIAAPDLLADGYGPNGLELTVTQLSLTKLFANPPLWLRLESDEAFAAAPAVTDIKSLSPRHYRATVAASEAPYYVVLNQASAPAWHLSGVEVLDHVTLNGGLNGWLIKPVATTTIDLTYASYAPYWLGIIISVLTIGFVKWRLYTSYRRHN